MAIVRGIPDKLGNRYEAKWLVRQLFDVIAGKADWVRYEGITPEFGGFEFTLKRLRWRSGNYLRAREVEDGIAYTWIKLCQSWTFPELESRTRTYASACSASPR
jgi:hypothetical protein